MTVHVVIVGIASRNNQINGDLETSLWINARTSGASMLPLTNTLSPLHFARSQLVRQALASKEVTHLWFVDDDVVPEPDCLKRLLLADKPIVHAPYRLRSTFQATGNFAYHPISFGDFKGSRTNDVGLEAQTLKAKTFTEQESREKGGLLKVDWVGMGCTLIRRDALEAIPADGFFLPPKEAEEKGIASAGEDIMYCISAAKLGIPVHALVTAGADHVKQCRLSPEFHFHGDIYYDQEELLKDGATLLLPKDSAFPEGYLTWIMREDVKLNKFVEARKKVRAMVKRIEEAKA